MANLKAQIAADLSNSFLRIERGFASAALLAATVSDRSVPVTTGVVVAGIFDAETQGGGDREGPRFWCAAATGFEFGRHLTVTGEGTFRIEARRPGDAGDLLELYLARVT